MLSAAEKKLILVGSAAVVALTAVCTGVLITVKDDHPQVEPEVEEVSKGEFPMRYFQADRRNYVSDDGNLAVIGPAWDKVRVENGKELYPIVVLHKSGEVFREPYILHCALGSGEKGGAFRLTRENVLLEDLGEEINFTYSDGDERISVKLNLVSAVD